MPIPTNPRDYVHKDELHQTERQLYECKERLQENADVVQTLQRLLKESKLKNTQLLAEMKVVGQGDSRHEMLKNQIAELEDTIRGKRQLYEMEHAANEHNLKHIEWQRLLIEHLTEVVKHLSKAVEELSGRHLV